MTLKECYEQCGGDYEETLQRLHNENLIGRFLLKFLDDTSYTLLLDSIASKDGEVSFRAAHTLKGVALNLGLTSLFAPSNALTEALRNGWNDEAIDLLPPVTAAYEHTAATIRAWQDNKEI